MNGGYVSFIVNLDIEKLPEGYFLATSKQVQGLVAQGRTLHETIEIAQDVARKLFEARTELSDMKVLKDKFQYPLIVEM